MPDSAPAFDLSDLVRERLDGLNADRPSGERLHVPGVLDFAAARPRLRTPCAAALALDDRPGPPLRPDIDAGVAQRVRTTVAVVVGVSAPNDDGGSRGTAADALRVLVAETRDALLGWTPGGPLPDPFDGPSGGPLPDPSGDPPPAPSGGLWRPLVLQRGRLLSVGEGRAWWQDEYVSERLLRSRPREAAPGAPARPEVRVSVNGAPPVPLREAFDG